MAKRKVCVDGCAKVRVPAPSMKDENEFSEVMTYMISTMAERFRNQTFKRLNKGTIEKFEDNGLLISKSSISFADADYTFKDKQIGNYANIFLRLARASRRNILKEFSDKRIRKVIGKILTNTNKRNRSKMYTGISGVSGISSKELIATEGLGPHINAIGEETLQWVNRARDNALSFFVSNSLRGMSLGLSVDEVIDQFKILEDKTIKNADMVARTQIGTYNSLLTKARARNLGIDNAKWITAEDERVRPSHKARQDKIFNIDEGLYSSSDGKFLLPGEDYNCRCDYELQIDDVEDLGEEE